MGKENAKSRYGKKVMHVSFGLNLDETETARRFYPESAEANRKAKELFKEHIEHLQKQSSDA